MMRPWPRIQPPARRGGIRRWVLAGACACAALAAGVAWRCRGAPDLPRLRLDGVDPAVISAIDRSMSRVRASPGSANRAAEGGWQDPYLAQLTPLRAGLKPALVRADVLIGAGRHAEALEALLRLAREYPGAPWVWILLGRTRIKLRDLDGAERALLEALRLEPGSVEAQFRMGVSLSLRGKYADAAEWFQKAVAIKPDFARAWFDLGQCLDQLGRPTESIEAFRSAIRHEPENAEGLAYLGHVLARTGALEEAERLVVAAARLRPASPWIADRLADVEARRDEGAAR